MSNNHQHNGFQWPIRIYYEDTDAGGVVFYANYLCFMERARTEWLRDLGFEQDRLRDQEGVIFAVRKVTLDYQAPARLDDLLRVETRVVRAAGASIEFDQTVVRETDATCCCHGAVKVGCLNAATLRPRRLPDAMRSALTGAKE